MNPVFSAKVEKGKLLIYGKKLFNDYLSTLDGKDVRVVVGKIQKSRSNKENAYYWGVVLKLIGEEIGLSTDETHEALKILFLKKHVDVQVKNKVEPVEYVRSTASLSTIEFEEYLENIRMWAASFLNCQIPLPNEVDFQ